MELLVVGATGRTGREVVDAAVARGHGVRAFARSAGGMAWPDGVVAWPGDALDADDVDDAMDGMDAVIVAISMVRASNSPWARILTPTDLHHRAAQCLTRAAARHGVGAYVTVSAQGVAGSRDRAGTLFLALVHASNIGVAYDDLAEAEDVVRESDVPWTIVRPTRLTEGPPTGRWDAGEDLMTSSFDSIPRADLATFLVEVATTGENPRAVLTLTRSRA